MIRLSPTDVTPYFHAPGVCNYLTSHLPLYGGEKSLGKAFSSAFPQNSIFRSHADKHLEAEAWSLFSTSSFFTISSELCVVFERTTTDSLWKIPFSGCPPFLSAVLHAFPGGCFLICHLDLSLSAFLGDSWNCYDGVGGYDQWIDFWVIWARSIVVLKFSVTQLPVSVIYS